jgi:hypothetical protein
MLLVANHFVDCQNDYGEHFGKQTGVYGRCILRISTPIRENYNSANLF